MGLINYLTAIQFEDGAISCLPDEMAALGISRPMIVTDGGIRAAGLLDRVLEHVPGEATIFDETPSNPTERAVIVARLAYAAGDCDGLIAVGGGSPIDLAKGVRLLATHDGELEEYAAILGGLPKITPAVAPLIAVPTTAGTGSEVGRAALLTLSDGRKLGFISPHMIPNRAICDPALTLGMPAGLTAATGMDALTHCFETFLSPRDNPPADAIALDGAGRAWRYIERAYRDGSDAEARREMMMASLEGGLTFQKGLGAVHSMSHPLGGLTEPVLHHGTLNAVILPAVLRFNAPACEEKYDRLRAALGLAPGADLAEAIEDLNARLDLPNGLAAMGVTQEMLPPMVDGALADHSTATNPRTTAKADFEALFQAAMGGA